MQGTIVSTSGGDNTHRESASQNAHDRSINIKGDPENQQTDKSTIWPTGDLK